MSLPNSLSSGHHRSVSIASEPEPGSPRVSDVSSEHRQSSGVPNHGPHTIPVSRYAIGQKNPVSSPVQESPPLTSLPRYNESDGHKKSVSLNKHLRHFGYAPIQTSNPARESKEYPSIPKWPRASVTLGKTTGDIILHILHDFFMVIVPIPFFVLAGIVIRKNGKLVDDNDWHKITTATKLAVTIFPIAFAAVVGRATKAYASWRLERGVPLGFIEQLLGSQTFFGTLTTQFFMRSYNLVGLGLLVFWCLSPLGGQSSLRIIATSYRPVPSNASILYLNTRAESPFSTGGDTRDRLPQLNALYLSSLMAPESVKASSMDLWGNVKIPRLGDIQSEPDSDGWHDVSPANSSYNSLMGVPISGLPEGKNTTFNLESSYFDLEAINATFGPEINIITTGAIPGENFNGTYFGGNGTASCKKTTVCASSFQIGIDHFANYNWTIGYPEGIMNNSIPYFGGPQGGGPSQRGAKLVLDERPPHILFQSRFWGDIAGEAGNASSRVFFRLQQIYVESAIKCDATTSQPNCSVVSIRPSKQPHPPPSITSLSFALAIYNFADSLAGADGLGHEAFSSTTELFIMNPATPLLTDQEDGLRIWEIPLPALSLRLTQIFNAYWQGSINSGSMVGDMASAPFETDEGPPANLTSPAKSTALELTYVCDWAWLSIFLLSTVALLVGAIAGVILDHISIGPDILGYASSLTRDSPYVRLPRGGSTLGGFERARLLKSMEVRLGDVRSESDKGYVVFGSNGVTGRMTKGRYYD